MLTERANWVYLIHLWGESRHKEGPKKTLCVCFQWWRSLARSLWVYNSPLFALLKWGKKLRNKRALCPSAAREEWECPRACVRVLHPTMPRAQIDFAPWWKRRRTGQKKKLPSKFFDDVSSLFYKLLSSVAAAANFVSAAGHCRAKAASPFFALKTRRPSVLSSLIGLKTWTQICRNNRQLLTAGWWVGALKWRHIPPQISSQLNCTMAKLLCNRAACFSRSSRGEKKRDEKDVRKWLLKMNLKGARSLREGASGRARSCVSQVRLI